VDQRQQQAMAAIPGLLRFEQSLGQLSVVWLVSVALSQLATVRRSIRNRIVESLEPKRSRRR
jgi:hypothetical protein